MRKEALRPVGGGRAVQPLGGDLKRLDGGIQRARKLGMLRRNRAEHLPELKMCLARLDGSERGRQLGRWGIWRCASATERSKRVGGTVRSSGASDPPILCQLLRIPEP